MTTEPLETLVKITKSLNFVITSLGHLFPFGEGIDRVCYSLNDDPFDEQEHRNADEVYSALCDVGVEIKRGALDDYPWKIWEEKSPNADWLENDLPKIFNVLNCFGHGIYAVSYEPRGAMRLVYGAAYRDAWYNADSSIRSPGAEWDDLSKKAASVVFSYRLTDAVYKEVKLDRLTMFEAAQRLSAVNGLVQARWPYKEAEARVRLGLPYSMDVPKFDEQHEELLKWAIWQIVNDEADKAN